MADDDSDDFKMCHSCGKLGEHCFLNSDAAALDGIKISCLRC